MAWYASGFCFCIAFFFYMYAFGVFECVLCVWLCCVYFFAPIRKHPKKKAHNVRFAYLMAIAMDGGKFRSFDVFGWRRRSFLLLLAATVVFCKLFTVTKKTNSGKMIRWKCMIFVCFLEKIYDRKVHCSVSNRVVPLTVVGWDLPIGFYKLPMVLSSWQRFRWQNVVQIMWL